MTTMFIATDKKLCKSVNISEKVENRGGGAGVNSIIEHGVSNFIRLLVASCKSYRK